MAEFINTLVVLGDDAVIDAIIDRTITEFKDNVVTEVGAYAFYGCAALDAVDLPNVTKMGPSAFRLSAITEADFPELMTDGGAVFYECKSLIRANLPKLTAVSANLFDSCAALTEVNIPNATYIQSAAFKNCTALMTLDCPKVTEIKDTNNFGAFNSNCLNTLILRSGTMCSLANVNAFGQGTNANTAIGKGNGYIYVPRSLVDSYKAATNWSTFAAQFRALEDYTVDGTITGELDETKI